jgi:2OG-Fe(II) oxygenase superfamily
MTNSPIQVAYHQGLKSLETLLDKVRRPGNFFVHGVVEVPMPKVEVDGVGMLSFPVPQSQIRELIQFAERAPYGLGEKTVLDTSVRKVWQIAAKQVRLSGKSWATSLQKIVDQVAVGLGCEAATVSVELYKMLIYDQGSFFAAHRDTEKSDGMFGTLVVVLPSAHRGGELVIQHAGREVTVDVSTAEMSELAFIAFYADCQHEVKPIVAGNQLCLVYNLLQRQKTKKKQSLVSAPIYDTEVSKAARLIKEALFAVQAPAKIVWLLEHHYSPDGLSLSGLKNADAARAKVLSQAAAQAGCVMHLGIVHISEAGSAESQVDDYYSRGRRRYSYDDEDDENDEGDEDALEENVSDDDFEIVDVCESLCYVDQWVDAQDRHVEFGQIPLGDGELLPKGALDHEKPDQQRLTEATGNAGASFERSYHRAALVLWPQERFVDVLLQAGVGAAIPYVKEQVAWCCAAASPAARAQTVALVTRVLEAWINPPERGIYGLSTMTPNRAIMLEALGRLADATLLERFIGGVVTPGFDGTENAGLAAYLRLLNPESASKLLVKLLRTNMPWMHGSCVNLLRRVMMDHVRKPEKKWMPVLKNMATAVVEGLLSVGVEDKPDYDHWDGHPMSEGQSVNAALVVDLFVALPADEFSELRNTAAVNLIARPAICDPGDVVVPALTNLHAQRAKEYVHDQALLRLWIHAGEFLLKRSEYPPEAPNDWRQSVTLTCSCKECRALQAFARDAKAQVARFSVRQDLRQHIEYAIGRQGIDMTYVTEAKGSPHTLICTKTRRTYQKQCEQYQTDIKSLAALIKALPDAPDACTVLASRMSEARKSFTQWSASAT